MDGHGSLLFSVGLDLGNFVINMSSIKPLK